MIRPQLPPPLTAAAPSISEALADNWRALDHLSGSAQRGAAVKANAYGLGVGRRLPMLLRGRVRAISSSRTGAKLPSVVAHATAASISVLHGPLTRRKCAFRRGSWRACR